MIENNRRRRSDEEDLLVVKTLSFSLVKFFILLHHVDGANN
jgi:hypothetical protein